MCIDSAVSQSIYSLINWNLRRVCDFPGKIPGHVIASIRVHCTELWNHNESALFNVHQEFCAHYKPDLRFWFITLYNNNLYLLSRYVTTLLQQLLCSHGHVSSDIFLKSSSSFEIFNYKQKIQIWTLYVSTDLVDLTAKISRFSGKLRGFGFDSIKLTSRKTLNT